MLCKWTTRKSRFCCVTHSFAWFISIFILPNIVCFQCFLSILFHFGVLRFFFAFIQIESKLLYLLFLFTTNICPLNVILLSQRDWIKRILPSTIFTFYYLTFLFNAIFFSISIIFFGRDYFSSLLWHFWYFFYLITN